MGPIFPKLRISVLALLLTFSTPIFAQVIINSEYVPDATFKNQETGKEQKLDLWLSKFGANLPIIYKPATENRGLRLYGIALSAKHLHVSGEEAPVNDVASFSFGLTHYRKLRPQRWGLLACAGVGMNKCQHIAVGHENFTTFGLCQLEYRARPSLPIGFGLAYTDNFDMLLIAPTFSISYKNSNEKYGLEVSSMAYDFKMICYRKMNEHFRISLRTKYDRIGSPVVIDGEKDQLFAFNYIFSGISPEYRPNTKTTIGSSFGLFLWQKMTYRERNLRSIFHSPELEYAGKPSPFASLYFVYSLF